MPRRTRDPAARRLPAHVVKQHALADPRLAAQHKDPALSRAHRADKPVEGTTLVRPVDQLYGPARRARDQPASSSRLARPRGHVHPHSVSVCNDTALCPAAGADAADRDTQPRADLGIRRGRVLSKQGVPPAGTGSRWRAG